MADPLPTLAEALVSYAYVRGQLEERDAEIARLRKIEAAARALVSAEDEFAGWDEDRQSRDQISHLMHAIAPAKQALRAALAEGGSDGN